MEDWDPGRWLRRSLAWERVLETLREAEAPADLGVERRKAAATHPGPSSALAHHAARSPQPRSAA